MFHFRVRVYVTLLVSILLFGGLPAIACGGSEESNTPTPGTTTAPAATATKVPQATSAAPTSTPGASESVSVTIKDFEFTPATVTIKVGDTVTWTNDGPSVHTATADDGSFDSGDLSQGKTFSHTFQTAGTFSYHCSPHPFMKANVIVE